MIQPKLQSENSLIMNKQINCAVQTEVNGISHTETEVAGNRGHDVETYRDSSIPRVNGTDCHWVTDFLANITKLRGPLRDSYNTHMTSENSSIDNASLIEEKLKDSENKIWTLHDVALQVVDKVRTLDSLMSSLMEYGTQVLEPWRCEATVLVSNVNNAVWENERRLNMTNAGCHELEERIALLRDEVNLLRKENEEMKEEIKRMRCNQDQVRQDKIEVEPACSTVETDIEIVVKELRGDMEKSMEIYGSEISKLKNSLDEQKNLVMELNRNLSNSPMILM